MDDATRLKLRIGAWCVDPKAGRISRDGEVQAVEARTMRLLTCLAERPGETRSINELLDRVWAGVIVTPDSVYQAITSLRRLLGDDPKRPEYIVTVPRQGYRLVAPVSPWSEEEIPVPVAACDALPAAGPPPASPAPRRRAWLAVLALALLAGAGYAWVRPGPRPSGSVAVLAFSDLTTQEMNEEFFADGLTEELIDELGRMPGLRVPAAAASFYFKGKRMPLADVARELHVAYVVDGSVRKAGDAYRVAARLVRVDDGYVLWTDTYERPLGDLVRVQQSVAADAARAIRSAIEGARADRNSGFEVRPQPAR
jgi:TolB-like protein/DNA-binding winged helix-turn-helix (wHTH) protein